MSRVASFSRIALLVVRSRAFRASLVFVAAIWAFDALIFGITQRNYFASLGFESWFWRGLGARFGLFFAFFGICLALTRACLGALTRAPLDNSLPLRGALSRLEALREQIARLSWIAALFFALVLSRDFAGYWLDWLFLRGGARSDFAFLGLNAGLWTHFLPVFAPFLGNLWGFSLALGVLLLATALLRALPVLVSRNAAPPPIARLLWRYAAYLWALRAALYAVQILDLSRGKVFSSGDLLFLTPFFALGALACLTLCFAFLRRATQTVFILPRAKSPKWVLASLGALFLPALAAFLSAPIRAFLPETPLLRAQREAATRAAWRLNDTKKVAVDAQKLAPIEQIWPVWNETQLLASHGGAAFRDSRLVTWKSATLDLQNGAWSAILVGENADAQAWNSSRIADESTSLTIENFALNAGEGMDAAPLQAPDKTSAAKKSATFSGAAPAFFGIEGRSLFGKDAGISLASPLLRWAWAWRMRDLFLPFDAQSSPRLLTFRGARERAQILAPFLSATGQPRLLAEGGKLVWALDLCAATRNFPGAPAFSGRDFKNDSANDSAADAPGELAGANAASSPLQMRMDARSGAIGFVAPRPPNSTKNEGGRNENNRNEGSRDALLDSWRAAFPEIARNLEPSLEISSAASFGVGPQLLRAQAGIAPKQRGEDAQFYRPQIGFDKENGAASSFLVVEKEGFEVWQSSVSGSFSMRGEGDLRARLERIDTLIAQSGAAQSPPTIYRAGDPFVWRDARAPGGFWLARGFFVTPIGEPNSGQIGVSQTSVLPPALSTEGHGPFLWRVAVTGTAKNATVGVGNSLSAAFFVAMPKPAKNPLPNSQFSISPSAVSKSPLNSKAPQKMGLPLSERQPSSNVPPEVLALRTHEALQNAARRSDWKAFGSLARRETALLKQLELRRQNEARRALSSPNQTKTPAP